VGDGGMASVAVTVCSPARAGQPHGATALINIHVEVPVTLREAALGARIEVPTISGPVTMTVPKGSNTGTTLRLRDRGIRNRKSGQRGHQFITLKVVLPETEEPELAAFLKTWHPKIQQEPRKEMLK
jgi:DnaJ-class molecular chaperone